MEELTCSRFVNCRVAANVMPYTTEPLAVSEWPRP
jgi:hypothetical protein